MVRLKENYEKYQRKPYQDLRDQLSDEQQARSAELAERLRKAVHKCNKGFVILERRDF